MADNAEIKVSIERALHDGLRTVVEGVEKRHGMRIVELRVQWRGTKVEGMPTEFEVVGIEITSASGEGA